MAELKDLVREQYLLIRLDEERAVQALPKLLPTGAEERRKTLAAIHRMVSAHGELSEEGKRRFARIETLFDVRDGKLSRKEKAYART